MSSITTVKYTAAGKRQKNHDDTEEHHHSLLPGIPDHIAQLCLSTVPPSTLFSVCRSWRRLIYSPTFPPFPSLYALLISTENQSHISKSNPIQFSSFDPVSSEWLSLPPPPDPPLRLLYRHPSYLSRTLPIQSVAVSGKLVLLAATAEHFLPALSHPLLFDPISKNWANSPPLSAARRWCAAGALCGSIYAMSGIGVCYDNDVARSVEMWEVDVRCSNWGKLGKLRDSKFSREAIDAVGWKGKLCMVNVKGDAAKEGVIYDVESDSWSEMPEGMVSGWRGPAAAMAEEVIYVVDESRGWLKRYDHVKDTWVEVVKNEMFIGARQVVASGGKVCVLCADGLGIAVVDVAATPGRIWMVDVPPGVQAVGIHVLPRLSYSDV